MRLDDTIKPYKKFKREYIIVYDIIAYDYLPGGVVFGLALQGKYILQICQKFCQMKATSGSLVVLNWL